ncbi:MAG: hypothetical protein S0880_03495 [Actinomycetota bacterium]|nr:hypothetical protein [Actinomycetota bacterium]
MAIGVGVGVVAFVVGLVVGNMTSASDDTTLAPPTSPPPVDVGVTTSTTTAETTTTTFEPLGPEGGPDELVAATADGRLVVVDLETGDELELDDVTQHPGAESFGRIQLSPDRSIAYYAVLTGAAEGYTAAIATDGTSSGAARVADGISGALDADGSRLLTVSSPSEPGVVVTDLDRGESRFVPDGEGRRLRHPSWVPDGGDVAFAEVVDESSPSVLVLVDTNADDLAGLPVRAAPSGGGWTLPIWRNLSSLWVVEQCCGVASLSGEARFFVADPEDNDEDPGPVADTPPVLHQEYDTTTSWLVYVTTDGVARWAGGGELGVELGDGYLAADW